MIPLLTSEIVIMIIWPIIFVVVEVACISLLKGLEVARGLEKYKISYEIVGFTQPHSGPASIQGIEELIDKKTKIIEIDRLPDSPITLFSFGPELCITALATHLTIAFAAAKVIDPLYTQLYISLSVVSLSMLMIILILLKYYKEALWTIAVADFIGVLNAVVPFIFLGGLLIK